MKSKLNKNKKVKPYKAKSFDYNEFIQTSQKAYKTLLLQEKRNLVYNETPVVSNASIAPNGRGETTYQTIVLNEDGSVYEQVKVENAKEKMTNYYFIFADGRYASAKVNDQRQLLEGFTIVEDASGIFHEVHTSFLPLENNGITFEMIEDAILSFDRFEPKKEEAPKGMINA